eukprot:CAMPEP_0117023472 /NCGR_PEP_ID=MMETSP0472-20121206/17518_1 /TAXON_ID=693140 ORGANISM="Tiarina fusus, Strain LIS" /NCGR_SAMPLE_ID=MMETSP0472 /ASSEMBLY_ACC=CAM_ASM_000603 /LENGTH=331 /DNA_ID=CAMNT_0004729607 /DNA_START=59 /DNA_END=1052 /DNA_ORIENTATION=-
MVEILPPFLPITPTTPPPVISSLFFSNVALFAVDLFNNRTCQFGEVLPNTIIKPDLRADLSLASEAIRHTIDIALKGHTFAIGYPLSQSAVPSADVGTVYGIAQFSSYSPTVVLSNDIVSPFFSRSSASTLDPVITVRDFLMNQRNAVGIGWTEIAIIATTDDLSLEFPFTLINNSPDLDVKAFQQFLVGEPIDVELREIQRSGARVMVASILGDYIDVLEQANEYGLVGENFVWVVAPSTLAIPLKEASDLARGTIGAIDYFPPTSPLTECFVNTWKTVKNSKYPLAGSGIPPPEFTFAQFDAVIGAMYAIDKIDKQEMLDGNYVSPETW